MKIMLMFILVGIMQASANTYAQEHRITLSIENGTFYDVVSQIEKQSEFMFFYKSEEIDNTQKINLNVKDKLISEVLNEIMKNSDLTYKVMGKHIVITKHLKKDQNGKTVTENAMIKAQAYYKIAKIPTIAGDTALYIKEFEKQPGLYVHRINGKELTMEETQNYYIEALKKVGGESEAYYYTGLAIIKDGQKYTKEIKEDTFIFTSKVSDKPSKYDGLSRIQIDPKLQKYICELTEEDIKKRNCTFDIECVNFIKSVL